MRFLLDTNIVSNVIRDPGGRVTQRIREVGESQVCTSVIVSAELRFGAAKKGSERLTARLDAVLRALQVIPFESPADATYGLIRARLEKSGRVIGAHDLLIAAHALTLGCTVVTADENEFARIQDLRCENWLR
jgi:tRNA(fMet)-specific endonuclease VapC